MGKRKKERKRKKSEVAQSCLTLCNPVDCSLPGFSVHGILQARTLEWVAISFSRGSSPPRDQTRVSRIGGRRFNLWATRRRWQFSSWAGKIPWWREWQLTPVFLPGRSHRQRSLAGYSPWGWESVGYDSASKQQTTTSVKFHLLHILDSTCYCQFAYSCISGWVISYVLSCFILCVWIAML